VDNGCAEQFEGLGGCVNLAAPLQISTLSTRFDLGATSLKGLCGAVGCCHCMKLLPNTTEAAAEAGESKPSSGPKKPTASKPSSKKPGAKKPKKPTAKKPSAKKPGAKKPKKPKNPKSKKPKSKKPKPKKPKSKKPKRKKPKSKKPFSQRNQSYPKKFHKNKETKQNLK